MKANELRFGNFISSPINKIIETDLQTLFYFDENEHQPIPLTEEWLVMFGFEKLIPEGSIFQLGEFHIQDFSPLGFYECRNHIKIEHVHQLQNLYFALTGEELTIK